MDGPRPASSPARRIPRDNKQAADPNKACSPQSASIPSMTIHRSPFSRQFSLPDPDTSPAVHQFIQLAFQSTQRASRQFPARLPLPVGSPLPFPAGLVVTPRPPHTLPPPFPLRRSSTLESATSSPNEGTRNAAKEKLTNGHCDATDVRNGAGDEPPARQPRDDRAAVTTADVHPPDYRPSVAASNSRQSEDERPAASTSSGRPGADTKNDKLGTPTSRPILVAKRRQSAKSDNRESDNIKESPKAQNSKTPARNAATPRTDSRGSPVNTVVQTYREARKDWRRRELQGDACKDWRKREPQGNGAGQAGESPAGKGSPNRRGRGKNWRKNNAQELEEEERDDVDPKRRVLVLGFPAYTQPHEVLRALTRFGQCEIDTCRKRVAVATFAEEAQARAAVSSHRHTKIFGEYIEIRPYTNIKHVNELCRAQKKVLTQQEDDEITMPDKLDLSGDFEQQATTIERAIQLTAEEALAVNCLYNDLELVLQQEWPGCKAIPFGSIPSGLGMKSSDADCYVQLGAAAGPEPAARFVLRARCVLARYPQVFTDVLAIPHANTPIVKLTHVPSGFRADVSAKTPLGARNSRLVRLLFAEPRLRRAALLLKYWAKAHRLSGTGRLSNYALTMMLVFYLQRPPALLPPVAELQRDPRSALLVDDWNAGFDERPLPVRAPERSSRDLLAGFFRFYDEFDFDADVVCPLLGRAVPKRAFATGELPAELARYSANVRAGLAGSLRHDAPFCVQDPFELSHNVATGVSAALAASVRAHLTLAARAAAAAEGFLCAALRDKPEVKKRKRGALTSVLHVAPRLYAALPNWRAALSRAVVDAVFGEMLGVRLRRGEDEAAARERNARAGLVHEQYTGKVQRALWLREVDAGGAGLAAREAAVSAALPALDAPLRLRLELWFREEPRNCNVALTLTAGNADDFRHLSVLLHSVVPRWLGVLLNAAETNASAANVAARVRDVKLAEPNTPAADVASRLQDAKLAEKNTPAADVASRLQDAKLAEKNTPAADVASRLQDAKLAEKNTPAADVASRLQDAKLAEKNTPAADVASLLRDAKLSEQKTPAADVASLLRDAKLTEQNTPAEDVASRQGDAKLAVPNMPAGDMAERLRDVTLAE